MFRHEFHIWSMLNCVCNYFVSFICILIYSTVHVQFIGKAGLQWAQMKTNLVSERNVSQQVAAKRFLTECKWDRHTQVGYFQESRFLSDRNSWKIVIFFFRWKCRTLTKVDSLLINHSNHMAWSLHLISVISVTTETEEIRTTSEYLNTTQTALHEKHPKALNFFLIRMFQKL